MKFVYTNLLKVHQSNMISILHLDVGVIPVIREILKAIIQVHTCQETWREGSVLNLTICICTGVI